LQIAHERVQNRAVQLANNHTAPQIVWSMYTVMFTVGHSYTIGIQVVSFGIQFEIG